MRLTHDTPTVYVTVTDANALKASRKSKRRVKVAREHVTMPGTVRSVVERLECMASSTSGDSMPVSRQP
jgi:hypothetical protein